MFTSTFYPTPPETIQLMVEGLDLSGKTILEPSAGKADIVNFLLNQGANVEACENHPDLKEIVKSRCKLVEEDFFNLTKDRASHYDFIIMNPPFNNGDKHLLHAYEIAAPGTMVICLLNANTVKNTHTRTRSELLTLIEAYGYYEILQGQFLGAERKTGVDIALVRMTKPGGEQRNEFQGFFMDGDPEQEQVNGLMSYNMIRDIVNRYTKAIQIFDEQLETAVKLGQITGSFFSGELGFQVSKEGTAITRAEFKKELQKSAWDYIFKRMNLTKYTTKGVKEDINKFVEQQQEIPFTMKNIYRMIEIVIATAGQRMDKALMEVFEKLTKHYKENRFSVEGWATNSHYLVNKRFISPYCFETNWSGKPSIRYRTEDELEDLTKALCYLTGNDYGKIPSLYDTISNDFWLIDEDGTYLAAFSGNSTSRPPTHDKDKYPNAKMEHRPKEWGQWFDWGFFRVRAYKKGTGHFEFKDENVWAMFNQRIAQIKGFPLPEKAHTTKSEEKSREKKEKAWQHASRPKPSSTGAGKTNPIVEQLIKEPINSDTILKMFS